MATSVNDPSITKAINTAMSAMLSKVGTRGGDWVWRAVYPNFIGQAWCGAFQVWGFRVAGVDLMKACWWFYVPYVESFARRIGAWTSEPGYGRQVIFDWGGDAVADHVGASNPDAASASYRSVEGNTSPGSAGSQSNGNGVWQRYRAGRYIRGWVDMRVVLAWMIDQGKWTPGATTSTMSSTATGKAKTSTDRQDALDQDGEWGPSTQARFRQVFSTGTKGATLESFAICVQRFQSWLNTQVAASQIRTLTGKTALDVDGEMGPHTWRVFQFWSGNRLPGDMQNICGFRLTCATLAKWCDGVTGTWTITMLQVCLNRSYAGAGKLLAK